MNLVIVRKADHTTAWFFNAKGRVLDKGHLMILGLAVGNARLLDYLKADEWASVETRKIDPDTWTDEDDAALLVEAWVYHERKLHANSKYGRGSAPRQALIDDTATRPELDSMSSWYTFITNYLSRAGTLRVSQPSGAQAAAKVVTTATHHLETVQLVWKTLPAPGDSSDGCKPWDAPSALVQARAQIGLN